MTPGQRNVSVVVIGASAGGIDALFRLFDRVDAPSSATIVTVLHLPEGHDSRLVDVLAARLGPHLREAQHGAPLLLGNHYIAPPGYHLLVEQDRTFSLSCDPPVLFSRPSIDVLMESCADAFGPDVAGVVLTGASEDGARGLAAIKAAGGLAYVQSPEEAAYATMPRAAMAAAHPDAVLPLDQLRTLLLELTRP